MQTPMPVDLAASVDLLFISQTFFLPPVMPELPKEEYTYVFDKVTGMNGPVVRHAVVPRLVNESAARKALAWAL